MADEAEFTPRNVQTTEERVKLVVDAAEGSGPGRLGARVEAGHACRRLPAITEGGPVGTLVEAIGLSRRFGAPKRCVRSSFSVRGRRPVRDRGPDGAARRRRCGCWLGSFGRAEATRWWTGECGEGSGRDQHHTAYTPQRLASALISRSRKTSHCYADLYPVPQADRPPPTERLYQFSRLGQFRPDSLAAVRWNEAKTWPLLPR